MRATISVLLISTLVVSGCGRANPLNWFGNGNDAPSDIAVPIEEKNPLIPESSGLFEAARVESETYIGTPVASITDVTLEKVPGGVMIRATGTTAGRAGFDARLTPENEDQLPVDGVLTYRFEAITQTGKRNSNPYGARELTVAHTRTSQELAGVDTIRIVGAGNSIDVRP